MLPLQSTTSNKNIPWKFEAIIFNTNEHMEASSNICNPGWSVTPRRTLTLIWRQSAGLQLIDGYAWLSINI